MAHESFEDEDVAELLNRNFIAIKLDREERPDVDMVYMAVCRRLTGSGGWPLSIFMTNEGNPYIATPLAGFASEIGLDSAKFENLLNNARSKLFDIRRKRIHPLKDDKILTSWNGLMIAALAKGYQALGDQEYIRAAGKAADFILKNLRTKDGKLLHRYRHGDAAYSGFLDDYAFLVWGLIELHEATFEVSYLEEAIALNRAMLDMFWDEQNGGLYFSGAELSPQQGVVISSCRARCGQTRGAGPFCGKHAPKRWTSHGICV
ncbi:DUF255 domain-containing protein [Desulfosarcina sp. BuS5]|uniref:DUF255 domain-containing protein n=1 Tax=Desulfosarcina sp. BuS5 TaxID=933262 RepID=UPI0004874B7B|nr:DUF255 domain-containing protein [Desulfosarcina sp. BuS5]